VYVPAVKLVVAGLEGLYAYVPVPPLVFNVTLPVPPK